jgi:hypothetical protein
MQAQRVSRDPIRVSLRVGERVVQEDRTNEDSESEHGRNGQSGREGQIRMTAGPLSGWEIKCGVFTQLRSKVVCKEPLLGKVHRLHTR